MQNVRNPWWLLITNTLPVILLASIYYGSFDTIHSLLSPESIRIWKIFSITLGCLWLIHLLYAVIMIAAKRITGIAYGFISICVYGAFLYIYYVYSDIAIPFDVPGWMMPEDITLFVGTFIMPTLAHALFVLVIAFTRSTNGRRASVSFGIAFIIPIAWYFFFIVLLPLWQSVDYSRYHEHIIIVLVLCTTAVFLFFVMRGIYIIGAQRGQLWESYSFIWRFAFGFVCPIVGLVVNQSSFGGAFGNFGSVTFFILAFLNGVAISIPQIDSPSPRMALFFLRSVTIIYVFYFFVVFLPYLPLSVLAIILVGAGFLMLTPLILMILQLRMMSHDIDYLLKTYSPRQVYGTMIAGMLVLPTVITFSYVSDKKTLTRALEYVYTPELADESTIDTDALNRVLATVKKGKDSRSREFNYGTTPYLTTYYNWLVLDNLTLSDQKINVLERVFNGEPADLAAVEPLWGMEKNDHVSLRNVKTSSVYDELQHAWKTTVDLEIVNESNVQSEFVTSLGLPDGAWISDYYLWIGKDKVHGILAEKKAATWIYQQIVSYRRDPGILYYLTGNRVALRVFPLAGNEVRKTGFEIIHKEPSSLTINGRPVMIGNENNAQVASFERAGLGQYVSAEAKAKHEKVTRKKQHHFIFDCSASAAYALKGYRLQVEQLAKAHQVDLGRSSFVLCDSYATTLSSWEEAKTYFDDEHVLKGGFFLERAIQKILVENFLSHSDQQPVIVVVTNNFPQAIIRNDFADLKTAYPESDVFFELQGARLVRHSLESSPMLEAKSTPSYDVVEWKSNNGTRTYLRVDGQPSVFFDPNDDDDDLVFDHDWTSALALQGKWLEQQFDPAKADAEWLRLVRSSFRAQIMSPVTSFISVENDAQRKTLLKKQQQLLQANPSLDAGEEVRMSEPGLWIIIVIMLVFITIRSRHNLFLYIHKLNATLLWKS